jgi:hypothetical protein
MNFEILDKVVYKTTQYLICGDDGIEYSIRCSEDDFLDYWIIDDEKGIAIDPSSELGSELIRFCMSHEEES